MKGLIVETLDFTDVISKYFEEDEAYLHLQNFLLENPNAGDVIAGSGGIRKARWSDTRRKKGKRSGLRIIYLYLPEFERILLIDVYDKSEQDDLSARDRKAFKELVDGYRAQIKEKIGGRGRS